MQITLAKEFTNMPLSTLIILSYKGLWKTASAKTGTLISILFFQKHKMKLSKERALSLAQFVQKLCGFFF